MPEEDKPKVGAEQEQEASKEPEAADPFAEDNSEPAADEANSRGELEAVKTALDALLKDSEISEEQLATRVGFENDEAVIYVFRRTADDNGSLDALQEAFKAKGIQDENVVRRQYDPEYGTHCLRIKDSIKATVVDSAFQGKFKENLRAVENRLHTFSTEKWAEEATFTVKDDLENVISLTSVLKAPELEHSVEEEPKPHTESVPEELSFTASTPVAPAAAHEEAPKEEASGRLFLGKIKALHKGFTDAKKTTATDKAAIDATGVTSLTPAKPSKKSSVRDENKANLSIEDIVNNFLAAKKEHEECYKSSDLGYKISSQTKKSFVVTDSDGKQLVAVEKEQGNSISYRFPEGASLDFQITDVLLRTISRGDEKKVLMLHTTNLQHMEEILKAAAESPNDERVIIKFDPATEKWLQSQNKEGLSAVIKEKLEADMVVKEKPKSTTGKPSI